MINHIISKIIENIRSNKKIETETTNEVARLGHPYPEILKTITIVHNSNNHSTDYKYGNNMELRDITDSPLAKLEELAQELRDKKDKAELLLWIHDHYPTGIFADKKFKQKKFELQEQVVLNDPTFRNLMTATYNYMDLYMNEFDAARPDEKRDFVKLYDLYRQTFDTGLKLAREYLAESKNADNKIDVRKDNKNKFKEAKKWLDGLIGSMNGTWAAGTRDSIKFGGKNDAQNFAQGRIC